MDVLSQVPWPTHPPFQVFPYLFPGLQSPGNNTGAGGGGEREASTEMTLCCYGPGPFLLAFSCSPALSVYFMNMHSAPTQKSAFDPTAFPSREGPY